MKYKVCGMKYYDNIKDVAALEPDFLGFIFYKKSARNFDGDLPDINPAIKKVGVFVDSSIKTVLKNVSKYNLDAVQLHGGETANFCANLKSMRADLEIIKVFSVDAEFDFKRLMPYEEYCDYFLFDTKGPLPGGNGYAFNWSLLKNYKSDKPFFLSGGIGVDSIDDLTEFFKSDASKYCEAIDLNSKLETEPGLKHTELVKTFLSTIKNNDKP